MTTKNTIIFLISLFISLSIRGQEFKAGAIGGVVFSQVDGDSYAGFKKPGLVTGLYVSRSFLKDWAAQMEIVYKQKGSRQMPDEKKNIYTIYKINLDYLEVPLLVKYQLNKLTFEVGVAFGTLIKSSEQDENGEINPSVPFEDYEWSTITGINYRVINKLSFNVRWSYSLASIRKPVGDYNMDNFPHWGQGKIGQFNHSISISAYYEFGKLFANR